MTIQELKKNNNFEILKETNIFLTVEILSINILYKTIIPLSVFEKFIIKVIDKAKQENISLITISDKEEIVNIEEIGKILSLDSEIIENNINKLSTSGLIGIKNGDLIVKWDKNLKNWEKEVIEEEKRELYFKDSKSIESFNNLKIKDKNKFFSNKYSTNKKTFHLFEIEKQDSKELVLKSSIILDKNNFELKVVFEKDNTLLTLSEEIKKYDAIQKLSNQELIIIEDDKIKNDVEIRFSKEQLDIINSDEKYILLKARAGSGKTAVIVERTKRLLKKGTDKSEILLLAFNTKASDEMNERVGNNFNNAKTFHSFAYSIVKPSKEILQDKGLSTFIQKIIQENWIKNDNLKNYLEYRDDVKEDFTDLNLYLSKDEYIKYIDKKEKLITFTGEKVKSKSEKDIFNILFKKNINLKYKYDKEKKKSYFSILSETKKDKYHNPIEIKKFYISDKSKENGRRIQELEEAIQNDTTIKELNNDEIYNKLKFHKISKLTKQIENFITNKQRKLTPSEKLTEKRESKFKNNIELYEFFIFANYIFRLYEEEKHYKNLIDFNDMLTIGINQMKKYQVEKLKYIMIDEFQDFSPLFFDLIDKIRSFNPDVKILAVGDDWQGINGFAGANLKYFENFKDYFELASEKSMLKNYRSPNKIVEFSNEILEGEKSTANKNGGEVFLNQVYSENLVRTIIKENPNKKIAVLVRTNDEKEKIEGVTFETAHKSKGLQYDIVIIKDASKFDYLHPDNKLLEIFDKSEEDFIEENKRVFYVAVTRAKEKLYICGNNSFF